MLVLACGLGWLGWSVLIAALAKRLPPADGRMNSLVRRDPATLHRLVAETRRVELVHRALWPFWLVTAEWPPPVGVLIDMVCATAFNLPCLWLQRSGHLQLFATLPSAA
ncbi:MAG: hypothetical protein WBM08_01210 [Prochlorococcaceae cyanobacterium]